MSRKILIADSREEVCRLVRTVLAGENLQIDVTADGIEADRLLRAHNYAALLVEPRMRIRDELLLYSIRRDFIAMLPRTIVLVSRSGVADTATSPPASGPHVFDVQDAHTTRLLDWIRSLLQSQGASTHLVGGGSIKRDAVPSSSPREGIISSRPGAAGEPRWKPIFSRNELKGLFVLMAVGFAIVVVSRLAELFPLLFKLGCALVVLGIIGSGLSVLTALLKKIDPRD